MLFIDLEKDYDMVLRDVKWWVLNKKTGPRGYIEIIKDICGSGNGVRTTCRGTCEFRVAIGLHWESALSSYLFTLIMDELIGHI